MARSLTGSHNTVCTVWCSRETKYVLKKNLRGQERQTESEEEEEEEDKKAKKKKAKKRSETKMRCRRPSKPSASAAKLNNTLLLSQSEDNFKETTKHTTFIKIKK